MVRSKVQEDKKQLFTFSSTLECPDCRKVVHVGTGGHKNLEAHRTSKACRLACRKHANTSGAQPKKPEKANQVLDSFFKPRVPLNPSTVSAPPPICPGESYTLTPERHMELLGPAQEPAPEPAPAYESPQELASMPQGQWKAAQLPAQHALDKKGVSLLRDLEAAVKQIPSDKPSATPEHRLSIFAIDPRTCVAEPGEDDWLILNQMMKSSFGWGEEEMAAIVPQLLDRGPHGLDGFIRFMSFFVQERGLQGALFETKVEAILKEIGDRYPPLDPPGQPSGASASKSASTKGTLTTAMETHIESVEESVTENRDIINVDEIASEMEEAKEEARNPREVRERRAIRDADKPLKRPRKWPCEGTRITFPEGTNHHMSYPFGLHSERSVPWNYHSIDDAFYLQAKSCQKISSTEGGTCGNCQTLTSSNLFAGILNRIKFGTHENVPLMYHGVGALIAIARRKTDQIEQLRMSKLNDSRKLLVKVGALEDHKQWIMAIASGRVDRVASLVQAGLKQQVGIKTLIQQYERAADKLYKPKGFTNEDIMRSIVLLRLGGARVAQFAHQSLALPSLTTIRRQTVLPALVVSPSAPTVADVEANVISCYSSFRPVSGSCSGGTTLDSDLWQPSDKIKDKIVHQVLMLDELAIEKRVRWDDAHNKFQGTCREHNHRIPLDFTSERELDILCGAIESDEVHLASEATVAAIGVLSSDPREYAVRPILFSGTCKKETSEQHARVIKTVLDACNRQKRRNNATYRTVCIASDGEAKRGDALVIQTMTSELSVNSPIYALLRPLDFLNLLVGPDDITADKDFKHIIKRQRNVFMRNKGVEILGFCITPSILRSQLEYNGVSSHQLRSLLNPNDKQDVVLAYSLLKEIWSLPPPPAGSDPAFALARHALNIYGEFAQHLMLPYVCVDQNLDEQLIHLSAAAHLAFLLYRHNSASTRFMPRQSYLDIVLMVKNAYFCVAKMKVDNPIANFYLISLGTDRLETFFGLIRTAVGTDANVDMLQLGSRASGLTEVAAILAEHPEWDYGTRRLSLPVFSKDTREFTSKADHINPRDWRGDVSVANVNLHTCWLLGRKQAEDLIPDAEDILGALSGSSPSIDMLSPFGELMVNQRDEIEEVSEEESAHGPRPQSVPYTHEGDIEDAIADEAPRNNGTSEILIQGQKTTKAKALRHRMANHSSRSSTDRLKRVQQLPCFDSVSRGIDADIITSSDGVLGAPSLRIGNPIAILVRCEGLVVLAVAQVNRLKFAGKDDLNELPIHLLADPTAKVDSQILRLVPATLEDDPTQVHDWCWSLQMEALCDNIPGQGVHPINPSLSVQKPGKPTFLFESTFLNSGNTIGGVSRSSSSRRIFHTEAQEGHASSATCRTVRRQILMGKPIALEHMGAHILHDAKLNASEERCGLCLRPASMCNIYLTKGRGVNGSSIAHFPKDGRVELSQSEKDGMKRVWGARFNQRKSYFSKKGRKTPLAISEAHRSRLPIASTTEVAPNVDEDAEITEDDDRLGDDSDGQADDGWDLQGDLYDDSTNPPPSLLLTGPPSSPSERDPTSTSSEFVTAAPITTFTSVQHSDLFRTNTPVTTSEEAPTSVTMATCNLDVTIAQVTSTTDLAQAAAPPTITPELSTVASAGLSQTPSTAFIATVTTTSQHCDGPGSSIPEGVTGVQTTRRHRIRKAHVLQLNACICGVTITDIEIQEGKGVMKCNAPGCETVWSRAWASSPCVGV
ncbi:hypothetical protein EDB86DRAFT_3208354 [Lactarius hatsudake]|nr:hypothetical protein EDB86DRAFT_3208354 [Lactarius hatsudake]